MTDDFYIYCPLCHKKLLVKVASNGPRCAPYVASSDSEHLKGCSARRGFTGHDRSPEQAAKGLQLTFTMR